MPTHRMQATFHSRAMGGVPNTLVYPNKLFSVFMTELKNSLLREYIDRQNIYFFKTAYFFLFTYYYYYSKVRVWARHFFNLFWLIRKMKYWVNNKSLPFFNFLHIGIDGLLNVKKVKKNSFFFIKKVFFPLFWCLVLMGGVWRGVGRRDWSNR